MHHADGEHHQRADADPQRHRRAGVQVLRLLAKDDVARPAHRCSGRVQHAQWIQAGRGHAGHHALRAFGHGVGTGRAFDHGLGRSCIAATMPDGQQHQQTRHRAADPDEVDGPARCKQRHRQRSAELDGHRNAERNRFQRQVEEHVHHAQRHAVTRHHPPVMAWHAVPPRASEQDQHQGREQQPQCRGALRAHDGEDLLGQRGAQRQRRHRAQQPQDGLQGKGRRGICRRLGRSSRRIHDGESRIRERERARLGR